MVSVVGVQFDHAGKLYYFDPDGLELPAGSTVLVETSNGQELGQVMAGLMEVEEEALAAPLRPVLRLATPQDLAREQELQAKGKEAFAVCREKIRAHQLDMKLISAKYMFDNSKILFCFTADERVDFRALVRDLSYTLHSRVELRQVGPRDEARMRGGLGPCGRVVCCRSFLHDFQTVSIKAAKDQNLALNPTKISGICGKLMCCLKYEQEAYVEAHKRMPRVGRSIETPDGSGVVTEVNVLRETVKVRTTRGDSSEVKEYTLAALTSVGQPAEAAVPEEIPAIPSAMPEAAAALPADRTPELAAAKPFPRQDRPPRQQRPSRGDKPHFGPGSERNETAAQRSQKPVPQPKPQRPLPVARTNPKAAVKKPAPQPTAPAPAPSQPSKQNNWRKALEDAKRAATQGNS